MNKKTTVTEIENIQDKRVLLFMTTMRTVQIHLTDFCHKQIMKPRNIFALYFVKYLTNMS